MNRNSHRQSPSVFFIVLLASILFMLLTRCGCQKEPITDEMIQEATEGGKKFLAERLLELRKGERVAINDKNRSDSLDRTALHDASELGSITIVNALIALEAFTEVQDKFYATPLHYAAGLGHSAVVGLLIDGKANIHARNAGKYTPLHLAAVSGHLEVVKLLIDRGAIKEVEDNDGRTPLQLAEFRGHVEVVKALRNRLNGIV